jgi:hypothetical protein
MTSQQYNCLIPRTLVMTPCICFYCGAAETGMNLVGYLYGLKTCDKHAALGERDCKAWLHQNKSVRLWDQDAIPELAAFLDHYKGGFPVRRSNGEVQEGWKFQSGSGLEPPLIMNVGGDWYAKCFYYRAGSETEEAIHIQRGAKLTDFDNTVLVRELLRALDQGVYKNDYEEHLRHYKEEEETEFPDGPGILEMVIGDRVRRVWVGGH